MDDDPILAAMRMTEHARLQTTTDEGVIAPAGGIPRNTVLVEGGADTRTGAEVHGSFERETHTRHGDVAIGVEGGISQRQGGRVSGFFKWVFGGSK